MFLVVFFLKFWNNKPFVEDFKKHKKTSATPQIIFKSLYYIIKN